MGTIIPRTEYMLLQPGLYPAVVEEVELADGEFGRRVKVKFQLDDDEEQGLEDRFLIGWASATFGPKKQVVGLDAGAVRSGAAMSRMNSACGHRHVAGQVVSAVGDDEAGHGRRHL